jgi:hypothetical protein
MPARIDPEAGQVYRLDGFYIAADGKALPKYLLVLGRDDGGDIVARLLTSQRHGRPKDPRCHHGDPYPSFYLGVLGDPLHKETWLDLRHLDDLDDLEFDRSFRDGSLAYVMLLDSATVCPALDCAASAEDTTVRQSKVIRDQRADFGCP